LSTQTLTFFISFLALSVSIGGFLSNRQATWSMRYYERWFQLARLVLDHPQTLLPLWCGAEQYQKLYGNGLSPEAEPTGQELIFAEMYVDFMIEVNRRGGLLALLTGRYPGRVPLSNPRTLHLWDRYIRSIYPPREQGIVDRAIRRGT